MKVLSTIDAFPVKNTFLTCPPMSVCMHVLGCARTDVRVMREATALVEAGFEVSVVDIEYGCGLPFEEEIRGVHVRHILLPSWLAPTRFKPWFLAKFTQAVLGALQTMWTRADIYHAHDETALPACYIAARLHHKPLVFDAHELPLCQPRANRWQQIHKVEVALLRYLIHHCAGVITVSQPIAQEIGHRYHVPEAVVVRNILPYQAISKNDRIRQYLGLDPKTRLALYQGLLSADRGLDRLIRAANFLAEDIVIIIMGKDDDAGATTTELEALITSEDVAHRVKIIPAVPYEELLDWTTSADLGLTLFPPDYSMSIRFSLPNKLFEYLMAGLPVLSTQLDAIIEVLNTYDVGRVVPSLAPADVGSAINAMLADTASLKLMHDNALRAAQECNWENERDRLIQLYSRILTAEEKN